MVRSLREAVRLGGHYFLMVTPYNRNFGRGQVWYGSADDSVVPSGFYLYSNYCCLKSAGVVRRQKDIVIMGDHSLLLITPILTRHRQVGGGRYTKAHTYR